MSDGNLDIKDVENIYYKAGYLMDVKGKTLADLLRDLADLVDEGG